MLPRTVASIVLAVWISPGLVAAAESLSELLEKAIYTEETVGDLDAAIRIYEKIVAQGKENRKFVAQAQYRRGKCLLKQGKKAAAEAVFQDLVTQFANSPDQKALVAKARKLLPERPPLQLDPVPWADGEQLELRVKLGGGLEIGDFILSARSGTLHGRAVWNLTINRNVAVNAPNLGLSQVAVDATSFLPIHSRFRHSLLGTVDAEYQKGQVAVRSTAVDGKKSDRTIELDGVYYDNEQGMQLFRRLPLAPDYQGKLPICATFGSGPLKLETEVTGTETLEVPAGKFECHKLLVKPVQQTFWISNDAHRYIVQFEAGGVTGVLQSIRQVQPGDVIDVRDDDLHFSLQAPADWYVVPDKASAKPPAKLYILIDPRALAVSSLHVKPLDRVKKELRSSLRALADDKIEEMKTSSKAFQIRADSWQEAPIAGLPAIRFVGDFVLNGRKRAQYCVLVRGKSSVASFVSHTWQDRFEEYRKMLDPIIATYKAE